MVPGAVSLTINPSTPAALVEYQLRDAASPGTVLVPWTQAAVGLASGTQRLTLNLPANAAWYLIDLRANSDPATVVSTTSGIGVGEVIAAAGQSLAADFWSTAANGDATTLASLGVAISPFGSALAAWDGGTLPSSLTNWAIPSDTGTYRSAFVAEFLRLVVSATGVAAALVGYGYSGTDIGTYWLPGQPDYANLISVLGTSGGKFGTFLWCQGHNDADARAGAQHHLTAPSLYMADLTSLLSSLAAAFPTTGFYRILCSIPTIQSAASAKFLPSGIEAIREAHLRYVASDPLATYVSGLDVSLAPDDIHPSQAGNVTFARHFYRAFLQMIGLSSAGDQGPTLLGYGSRARGSAAIALPVQQFGGTSFVCSGDPTTQFQVFPSGQLTGALPIAAVDLTRPSQISITLAATPADTQSLDVWYRLPFDLSSAAGSAIYDNNAGDGDGLTTGRLLGMLPTPISVPAPSQIWHRPILISPGVPMKVGPGGVAFAG